jgi:hypothetical protein
MIDDERVHLMRHSALAKCAAGETISKRAPMTAVVMRRPCSGGVAGSFAAAMTKVGVVMSSKSEAMSIVSIAPKSC